ncbi:hypothetical protein PPERSA_05841 [Pseudocohnilembus persalinus]|uniref:Uncharacterized protein n=1 Tax=Pseudocohnilembus persalinus TaxID=266149 RepID=A0A0V0R3V5_PSEPJ|nr:hypothetical protein PPERSA_05841 [Pseudocohnilembus persalinus]|eukprot:KRX09172.1 hypothetical protein PPERSA_05841 [Pseudocohnilembus persalinus]
MEYLKNQLELIRISKHKNKQGAQIDQNQNENIKEIENWLLSLLKQKEINEEQFEQILENQQTGNNLLAKLQNNNNFEILSESNLDKLDALVSDPQIYKKQELIHQYDNLAEQLEQ